MLKKLQNLLPFLPLLKPYKSPYIKGILTLVWVDLINVLFPVLIKESIDALTRRELKTVYIMAFAYLILMALQSWGRYWWRIYLMGSSHRIARELREKLFNHLQMLPLPYYQKVRTGDLMSRATNDVEAVRMAIGPGILVSADAIILFLLIVPLMFFYSVKLSLMAFAFYPVVPWLTKVLGSRIDTYFTNIQEKLSELSGFTQEAFNGVRLIKSFVLENETAKRFRELSGVLRKEGLRLAKYEAVFSPVLTLLTQLGTVLILYVGGMDVISGAITIGTFIAFQRFVVQLSWPMEAIGWSVTLNREGGAAYRRLEEILTVEPRIEYYASDLIQKENKDLLEVRDLNFTYDTDKKGFHLQLKDLNLKKGQKIGLVGAVGSGKSTFINLLLRLYETSKNSIVFEGKDIKSIPLSVLRSEMASVEQQVFLFSETIQANALLGMEGNPLSREELESLAKVASIDREIAELDLSFDTLLGEKGVNLSGGQKQRIAFVRALARHPKLLLLDDCFSAIDVEVESKIIDRFFDQFSNLSVLLSTHRLSAMPRMDAIWVLKEGKCVATGTHVELLSSNKYYQSLWKESEALKI